MYEQETEHETPHRPPVNRRDIVPAVVIALISIAGGIVIGFAIPWFPAQASSQAKKIDTLWYVLVVFGVIVFVAVETVVLFAVYKFRMKPGEENLDGPPIHGNTRLEIIWTAIPSALIAGLVVYAAVILQQIDKSQAGEVQVQVYAQQFAWSFGYPNPAGKKPIVSDDLYLIKGQPVDFRLHTSDVLHGFWIPAFRVQEDAVPGIITSLRATPTRLGTYDIICTELCGLGHSLMRSTVHVVTAAQYHAYIAKFVAAKTIPGATPPASTTPAATTPAATTPAATTPAATTPAATTPAATTPAATTPAAKTPAATTPAATTTATSTASASAAVTAAGKAIFTGSAGCGSCHTLADAKTSGAVGPDLDKYLKGKTAAFIRTSIVDPNAYVEKGFGANIMPSNFKTILSTDQINALVAYLSKVTAK
ncbi:MAG TPA: cytochrome c oxidase subunit II [Solirubrobacteraceae bacterium]|jgi:cytochrome c oxidase subunit 2|nr:cytochrome c oxidase subunit II [Solirubrobacteraceae bacterium]